LGKIKTIWAAKRRALDKDSHPVIKGERAQTLAPINGKGRSRPERQEKEGGPGSYNRGEKYTARRRLLSSGGSGARGEKATSFPKHRKNREGVTTG